MNPRLTRWKTIALDDSPETLFKTDASGCLKMFNHFRGYSDNGTKFCWLFTRSPREGETSGLYLPERILCDMAALIPFGAYDGGRGEFAESIMNGRNRLVFQFGEELDTFLETPKGLERLDEGSSPAKLAKFMDGAREVHVYESALRYPLFPEILTFSTIPPRDNSLYYEDGTLEATFTTKRVNAA